MDDAGKAICILVIPVMIFLAHTNIMFNVFGEPVLLISPTVDQQNLDSIYRSMLVDLRQIPK